MTPRLPALLTAALLGACAAGGGGPAPTGPIPLSAVPVSHGRSGVFITPVDLTGEPWAEVEALMGGLPPASTSQSERARLPAAIALFERLAAQQTPTGDDRPRNLDGADGAGQLDCIDESRNTTTYLLLLERHGLLRFHRTLAPIRRAPHFFNPHRTAVIQELASGRRFAVDSWFGACGDPARIQDAAAWSRADRYDPGHIP